MHNFINYNELSGVTFATYRNPAGYANGDVLDLIDDIAKGNTDACFDGDLVQARHALEDGAALGKLCDKYVQEIVEDVHAAIKSALADQDDA